MTIVMFFLTALGTGTTIVFSSTHWLLAWAGVEVSTMAIIPLMAQHGHPRSTEAATKYFLIQACGAGMLMFGTCFNAWMNPDWDIARIENQIAIGIITLALMLKLGLAPFHLWPPEVMQGLDLKTGLIMTTWQKLAPFALLIQISHSINPIFLTILGILSTGLAGWAGMNQTQLRKILAYSSTTHLGWMIIVIQYAPNLALMTLIIYIFMTMAAFLTLKESSSTMISTLTQAWSKNPKTVAFLALILLSLAGLPPLTGFSPKWLILEELSKQEMGTLATLVAMSALISLYFYVRLCYYSVITLSPSTSGVKRSWQPKIKQDKIMLAIATTLTLTLLPLIPLITALFLYYP
uniref:NADH-ubiquinone oxidoreductase chain 2 n=1 Tax=Hollandichthys multifasciatus TaxID=883865 RepID=J9PI72_9TELE|nr:NADH dehydrogenase subunit 2 [Hollandichthys multifasciatus]AEP95574.1 NADH dehydrogenase subunit 2 [Hollandichthys multifasciatus]